MSRSPRRKAIKRHRYLAKQIAKAMMKALTTESLKASWDRITAAQQRMIDRRDLAAFDLLAVAKESLANDSVNDSGER